MLLRDLLDLVAALDRRVPGLEREGEYVIARDAQGLRRAALKRVAELERSLPPAAVGAADTSVALARGSIAHILDWLDRHGSASPAADG